MPLQAAQAAGEGPHRPALWLLMHTNTSSAQHHWKPSSATFPGAGGCRSAPAGVAQKDLSGNSMDHSETHRRGGRCTSCAPHITLRWLPISHRNQSSAPATRALTVLPRGSLSASSVCPIWLSRLRLLPPGCAPAPCRRAAPQLESPPLQRRLPTGPSCAQPPLLLSAAVASAATPCVRPCPGPRPAPRWCPHKRRTRRVTGLAGGEGLTNFRSCPV